MGTFYHINWCGFLPSTVDYRIIRLDFIDELLHLPQISCRTWPSSKGNSRKQHPCFTSIVEGRVLVHLSHPSTPKIFKSPETENDFICRKMNITFICIFIQILVSTCLNQLAVFTPTWGIQNLKLTYFEPGWSLLGTKNSKCSTPKTQRLLKQSHGWMMLK